MRNAQGAATPNPASFEDGAYWRAYAEEQQRLAQERKQEEYAAQVKQAEDALSWEQMQNIRRAVYAKMEYDSEMMPVDEAARSAWIAEGRDITERYIHAKALLEELGLPPALLTALEQEYNATVRRASTQQEAEAAAAQHPILASGLTVANNLASGVLGGFDLAWQNARNNLGLGAWAPVDYNTPFLQMGQYSDVVRGAVGQQLNEAAGPWAAGAYGLGMGAMDAAAAYLLASVMGVGTGAGTVLLSSGDGVRAAQQAHTQGASDSEALRYGVGTGLLSAAGDAFDVGAAGKGATGISHGISGILQSARDSALADTASNVVNLLWEQLTLGEDSALTQRYNALLGDGLSSQDAAAQVALETLSQLTTGFLESAAVGGMSDALGRGMRSVEEWLGGTNEPSNTTQGLDTAPAAGNNGSAQSDAAQTFTEGAQPWHAPEDFTVSDRALPHLQNVEGYNGDRRKGVSGGHDINNFKHFLQQQFPNVQNPDGFIVSQKPHPTIPGVYEIYYRVPKQDGKGNFTGEYKTFAQPKTVYDPAVLSPQQISNWAMEAFTGPGVVIDGIAISGTASNGLHFIGYLNRENLTILDNFYFMF